MTVHRRPLLLSACAAALFLPACLSIQAEMRPIVPPEVRDKPAAQTAKAAEPKKDQFRELLPARPGETVAIRPDDKDRRDKESVVQKPAPGANPTADADPKTPVSPGPIAPPPPAGVKHAGNPPAPAPPPNPLPLPLPQLSPAAPTALPDPPLLAVVRAYAAGRPEEAIRILQALDPATQEFVLAVVPALARGASADLASDPVGVAMIAEQLRGAIERLEPRAALRLENIGFCRKVSGFGRYEPWPDGAPYHPGDQAQFYFEVRNLVSQPATGPRGETHLTAARVSVEVRDAHGRLVEYPDPQNPQRRVPVVRFEKALPTRGPVHDFHVLYPFLVPTAPGVYTATVEVRDHTGRRVVRTNPLRFDVAGQ